MPRYAALEGRHLGLASGDHPTEDVSRIRCRTRQSGTELVIARRTRAEMAGSLLAFREDGLVGHRLCRELTDGTVLVIETVAAVATSRDAAMASTLSSALDAVSAAPSFDALRRAHEAAWSDLWFSFDTDLQNDDADHQTNLRLNTFHLVQTLSPHTAELDVGAPARGWHGEAYRGHVFWDEVFIFRVLNLRSPRLTRALLRYRLRRLRAARRAARTGGAPGAKFPWQSGSDGREETQQFHLNPRSGRWLPDQTHRQRHVGLAIAYNVWTYYSATGDLDFLIDGGAEMMIEIARFFASLAEEDADDGRWHIRGVMGPDEFQTAYPGEDAGIDDNAYTNVLCAWVMTQTGEALEQLPPSARARLERTLGLEPDEAAAWRTLSERLYVPFLSNGLIAQFEGYDALRELDWPHYRARHGDIRRLDRILEAEGDDVNAYKASKQADVLMLLYLFSAEELTSLLTQLGYAFDPALIPELVRYYDARTSHGSTLSAVVHAWAVARSDRTRSWELFGEALRADREDVQGGTTREGIHLGAMCGTIDIMQSGYLGLDARSGALRVDPVLPEPLEDVRTRVRYRGQDVELFATREEVRLTAGGGSRSSITVAYRDRQRMLAPGAATTFRLVAPRREREGAA